MNSCRLINVAPCKGSEESDSESRGAGPGRNSIVSNRASSFEGSFSLDRTDQGRPLTARSLPPKINIIKSPSTESKSQDANNIKYSNSSPLLIKTRKLSVCSKTNLDTYLDYSVSPFTTKFELIGNKSDLVRKSRSSTHLNQHDLLTLEQICTHSEEPSFIQISNDLFCGNLSLVKNERQLCKMNIEYLIDMTNMRPEEISGKNLGKIPCNCLKQHSRMYMNVEIKETDFKSLFKSFCEVNKCIQKSRKSSTVRRVLIFGQSTYCSQVVCAAAQYLMVEYDMSVEMALKNIAKQQFDALKSKLDKSYVKYLSDFEKYLNYMSVRVFGKLGFEDQAPIGSKSLQAKRDMFEENFNFFDENEVHDFDEEEFESASQMQSSMTNLAESEDKKRSSMKKNRTKTNSKLKIAWM